MASAMILLWSPIPMLLPSCGPTTIGGFVISIIVYTIQRMCGRWFLPHISVKVFKLLPTFAHFNAASPVIFESHVISVCASLPHAAPSNINGRVGLSMSSTHNKPSFGEKSNNITAAATVVTHVSPGCASGRFDLRPTAL